MEIPNIDIILDPFKSGEAFALVTEFKLEIKKYLEELVDSPVRSLADIIAFNSENSDLVTYLVYDFQVFFFFPIPIV